MTSRVSARSQWPLASRVSSASTRAAVPSGSGRSARVRMRLEVGDVLLADLGELLLAVVALVGQPDAALDHVDDVAVGVAVVGVDVGAEQPAATAPLEEAEEGRPARRRRSGRRSRSSSGRIGVWPSCSTRSSSMKLANRSPIFRASSPLSGGPDRPRRRSSMISRTCCSAASASITNGPHEERSPGISAVSSQVPLTWPKRSSWMRMSGFMPSRASSRMLTPANLTCPPTAAPA